jgi:hypothetical protein
MKQYFLLLIMAFCLSPAMAQLKVKEKCADFIIDILDGTVNNIKPNVNPEEIKTKLSCFTSVEEENTSSKCGGMIAYKDKDIYFFTGRDYVEIKEKFQGKLTLPLMGAKRNTLFKWLGNPKIKDANWEAYQVQYGTLVLHFNTAQKVNKIQFSTKHSDFLSLCE